jgi:pilus assembly protein CpaC
VNRTIEVSARALAGGLWSLLLLIPSARLHAQEQPQVGTPMTVAVGHSTIVTHSSDLIRVMITDPEIADAVPVGTREVVVNAITVGSTTLLIWGVDGTRVTYSVRVTPNVDYLNEEIQRLFPGADVRAVAAGSSIVLTGTSRDPQVATRVRGLAEAMAAGADVVDQVQVPDRAQILLRVRMAEVSRSAMKQYAANLLRVDPLNLRGDDEGALSPGASLGGSFLGVGPDVSFSDAINFYFFHDASNVSAFISAMRNEGTFRSLAEPDLLAFPGEQASFLAGGEFPYPTVQGVTQQLSIEFKEFGIRLSFTPEITNSGAIRLSVAPEVSQLDFANGLTMAGFQVPALLSRRAQTVVELAQGQTFAIAGLMDNRMTESVSKFPLLGDIPILGALFRSKDMRDNQSELLVLVTPFLVNPLDVPPPLPTGELQEWDRDRFIRPTPQP